MTKYWVIDETRTQEHWLEVNSVDGVEYRACVKWDGCIHYESFYGGERTSDNRCYIHYCNLDDEIRRLLALRKEARKFFGKTWGLD